MPPERPIGSRGLEGPNFQDRGSTRISTRGNIAALPAGDILEILERQKDQLRHLASAAANRETFRYAPGKWSVREVVGHLVDAERVFSYRAVRFNRGDETPLPGFDENFYVDQARFDSRPLQSLIEELTLLRSANVLLFRELDPEDLARAGVANTYPVSVRALAFILAGHLHHHLGILRERYGLEVPALQLAGCAGNARNLSQCNGQKVSHPQPGG